MQFSGSILIMKVKGVNFSFFGASESPFNEIETINYYTWETINSFNLRGVRTLYAKPSLSSELLTSSVAAAEFIGYIGFFLLRDYIWIKFPPVEEAHIFLSDFEAM